MSRGGISRRSFLRGLGGAALALPFLEYARPGRARAGGVIAPTRYLVMFAGMSAGRENVRSEIIPRQFGAGYEVPAGLAPLVTREIRDRVAVVSNLSIPRSLTSSAQAPGGMPLHWHTNSVGPLLSGQRWNWSNFQDPRPNAATSDQRVAAAFGGGAGLHYRIQSDVIRNDPNCGVISWKGNAGALTPNAPIVNAEQAYAGLIAGITPEDPTAIEEARRRLARRKSAVDFVLARRDALLTRLGAADKQLVERHFDELRALEQRIAALDPGAVGGVCTTPGQPDDTTQLVDGYTNELERAPILTDIIRSAFLCNQARVATLCVTHAQSFLSARPLTSQELGTDCHETSHAGGFEQGHEEVMTWHVDVFANLVRTFADAVDVDGRSLLDNTAIIYLFEGGQGDDPQEGNSMSPHSADNMCALTAGLAAGSAAGTHLDGGEVHPASVLLTAMNNVGATAASLNEVSTQIDGLKIA